MTTVPAATTPTTNASSSTGSGGALTDLSGNFDTFLTLLTTQLQNQDPMNPMNSDQFTQELVQFSGVEQQINTNDNLKQLISLQQGSASNNAISYLGKSITITNGSGALSDGAAHWSYALGGAAASTTLTVKDSSGKVVYSAKGETAAGQHDFDWDGKDSGGNQLADGTYTLSVSSAAPDGKSIETAIASSGVVSEVNFTGSEPYLMVGTMAVPVSAVSAVDSAS
ncbi:MAG TPA: flagellar hook capping FlgD N-terminal domain-containing protein [Rhizomicrobium sp.]|nr:flagellar hook capping FlgD N-terminal domain-containing protein [Rhizomicrobium sp.]